MPARDGDARIATHLGTACQHRPDHVGRKFGNRHADQCQRHDGRAPHGVDVRERIGRGNAPEIARIIDDGCEEIGGGHEGLFVVELVNRSVVAGLQANHQGWRDDALRRA
jgi:hypothetical protein